MPLLAAASPQFVLSPAAGQNYVACEGDYAGHLQGITTNGSDAIYWSFTTKLVRTTTSGKIIRAVDAIDHHGDLTFARGKIYVAVNDRVSERPGEFNRPNPDNPARQWLYEYDADLNFLGRHAVPQVIYGAGGVAWHGGRFWVVGGLPRPAPHAPGAATHDRKNYDKNYLYEYDDAFRFVQAHELATGNTDRGIQTAEFGAGKWWFGTYETASQAAPGERRQAWQHQIFIFDGKLSAFTRLGLHAKKPANPYPDSSLGIAALPGGRFLIAGGGGSPGKRRGFVWMAAVDEKGSPAILERLPENSE